jgi:hypothetical protein
LRYATGLGIVSQVAMLVARRGRYPATPPRIQGLEHRHHRRQKPVQRGDGLVQTKPRRLCRGPGKFASAQIVACTRFSALILRSRPARDRSLIGAPGSSFV